LVFAKNLTPQTYESFGSQKIKYPAVMSGFQG